jgi:hypothetical protein
LLVAREGEASSEVLGWSRRHLKDRKREMEYVKDPSPAWFRLGKTLRVMRTLGCTPASFLFFLCTDHCRAGTGYP